MTDRSSDDHEAETGAEPTPDERLADQEFPRTIADPLDEFAPGVATFGSGRVVDDLSVRETTDEDLSEEINARDSVGDVTDDLLDPRNPRHAQWLKDHGDAP